jgi:hypothetical protein
MKYTLIKIEVKYTKELSLHFMHWKLNAFMKSKFKDLGITS